MTTVAPVFVDVTTLTAGNVIVYCGKTYTVLDVVAVAELGGHMVTGIRQDTRERLACYYNDLSPAELLSVGGA